MFGPVLAAPPAVIVALRSLGKPTTDVVTQLQQLSQLKAAGALTDAEFDAAKAKLLGLA